MAEELKLYYQNEARLKEECRNYSDRDDLIRNVFIKAVKMGEAIGFNSAIKAKDEIDNEIFDDTCDNSSDYSALEHFDVADDFDKNLF